MSERGSFTTQYFYNDRDYEIIRKALDKKSKYLCISPPATWYNGAELLTETIVSGKVGELSSNLEWLTIEQALAGVVTEDEVRVVVMCDAGSVVEVTKKPNGETDSRVLALESEWEKTHIEAIVNGKFKNLPKIRCSHCGWTFSVALNPRNFCPSCGAKMK